MTSCRAMVLLALTISASDGATLVAAAQDSLPGRRVALTFDDLPMTGGACNRQLTSAVTRGLTSVLERRALPAAGLVTAGAACVDSNLLREALSSWQAAGATIGNHSATHPDLNTTDLDAYLADVDRGQQLVDAVISTRTRWFRPPYLHTGNDSAKKSGLAIHLARENYRMAPVTVDNQEWVYAAVYADARRRGDSVLAARVTTAYVEHLELAMRFYERLSTAVLGREIPQVLLLHANLLNAEHLDLVADMLTKRGYRFESLAEAVADPAYRQPDPYAGPRGLSWLQRWAIAKGVTVPAEPREAEWIAESFRAIQRRQRAARGQ